MKERRSSMISVWPYIRAKRSLGAKVKEMIKRRVGGSCQRGGGSDL